MILLGKDPTWAEAKRQLGESIAAFVTEFDKVSYRLGVESFLKLFLAGDSNFIKTLINFDKNNISARVLKRISQFCTLSDFQPEVIGKVSLAAKSLCMWVRAMEVSET